MSAAPDLWHHYGRERATSERAVPAAFHWTWDQGRGQDTGPGAEVLGDDLTALCVADLGAGPARHAAHLARYHRPARVDAVDASAAQHALATDLYAHLAPRLRLVHADVVAWLRATPAAYDVLYSVFGALDFTDPRDLLPVAASALRPGGRLVFATLARHVTGEPAAAEPVPARIPARTPDGQPATLFRWVLRPHRWAALLDAAGLVDVVVESLPSAGQGPSAVDTLLVSAARPRRAAR
ncbi:class I SAM-dependent methyltransferase [Streptomyces buecherae]|uniref:class I SAM-dependent methyltransferase n=1 Tax=Streptomyces buecherae TaxID=2763006 RepID=UPI001C268049|nr:class I SAM-dependent methyltransferase [Streptomyces buecherae]